MADRRSRATHRSLQDRKRILSLESLEQRQVMAASVAVGAGIGSSPTVRLVDSQTGVIRAQATAFESTFKGGVAVAMADVDGDGTPELCAASGAGRVAEIRVFKEQAGSTVLKELTAYRTRPFGSGYRGGIGIASGDVDGNGRADFVAAKSRGAGTVSIFLSVNAADPIINTPYRSFTAFAGRYDGGASVAVAELGTFSEGRLLNAFIPDRRVEVVVGSGAGMRATVKAYDVSATPRVVTTIEPMSAELRGGVTVASGLYTGDNIDDLFVSAGRGGGGVTEVYAGQLGTVTAGPILRSAAFASLAKPNAQVFTAPVDTNGDGTIDRFLVTQGSGSTNPGIVATSTAGARTGTLSSLKGPLFIAAARPAFPVFFDRLFFFSDSVRPQFIDAALSALPKVTTASGLEYQDIVVGSGARPVVGKQVAAHYTGLLVDGRIFDTSRLRGTPYAFEFGKGFVIKGWDEGLATMNVGGRRFLTIPANLAYGDNPLPGSIIPKGATLRFEVELVSAQA
jgi:peptidylprolyl isomerase